MIICVCHNVSSSTVIALAKTGMSKKQIETATNATSNCGVCTSDFNSLCDAHTINKDAAAGVVTHTRFIPVEEQMKIAVAGQTAQLQLQLEAAEDRLKMMQRIANGYITERQAIVDKLREKGIELDHTFYQGE